MPPIRRVDPISTPLLHVPSYDFIADFRAQGDGARGFDVDAFSGFLNACPTVDSSWNSFSRPGGGVELFIPGLTARNVPAVYKFRSEPTWPAGIKSFKLSSNGARLTMDAADGDYLMTVPTGTREITFEGLIFHGAGIRFAGGARVTFNFYNCLFEGTRDYAIKAMGASVHDVTIRDCLFAECDGGLWQDQSCEHWDVMNCRFWRCQGEFGTVVLQSTRNEFNGIHFEAPLNPTATPWERSHITLLASNNWFNGIYFESEADGNYRAPAYALEFGLPSGLSGAPSNPTQIQNTVITGMFAEGSVGSGLPSSASGQGILRYHVPVNGLRIEPTKIAKHNGHLVNAAHSGGALYVYDNILSDRGMRIVNTHTGGYFSDGGEGWNIDDDLDNPDTTVALGWADASPAFVAHTCASVVQQSSPSDWRKLTIDNAGDFISWYNTTAISTNKVTFEIEAQAGTLSTMRMAIQNNTDTIWVSSPSRIFRLTGSREKYVVTAPWTSGKKYRLWVYPGDGSETSGTISGGADSIYIANPKLKFSVATITA